MDRGLPLTRRSLLAAGGAGAALLTTGGLLRATGPQGERLAESALVRSTFTPHVGSTFTLTGDDGRRIRARLDAVSDLRHGPAGSEGAFELLLHGSGSLRLDQTIATLHRPQLRTTGLLVSPAGTGRAGQDYSIVVNRPHSPRL
jgi:hypothetical protein